MPKKPGSKLPNQGEWIVANALTGRNAPFASLNVNFDSGTGAVKHLQMVRSISGLNEIAIDKFNGRYEINGEKGGFEATYDATHQTLELSFPGRNTQLGTSFTGADTFKAEPVRIAAGSSVASWTTAGKLQEAIRRALPLLPDEASREVQAMFTPHAIAIMAGLAALWAASHLAVVGEIADILLLIAGGILLGKAAIDVGKDLGLFMSLVVRAQDQSDLDEAATHFAAAVLVGGVMLVGTVLLSKRPGKRAIKPGRPVKAGELPTGLNLAPPSKIPALSRGAPITQGEQPALLGLTKDAAQLVRGLLNHIRRGDLTGRGMDCCEGCECLDNASGNLGVVKEGTSGASDLLGLSDHTMWEIGNEFIDTRPGWWRDLFKRNPAWRQRLNQASPGLAERLENGAVLSRSDYLAYKGIKPSSPRPKPIQ
jgi:hypothetical protein